MGSALRPHYLFLASQRVYVQHAVRSATANSGVTAYTDSRLVCFQGHCWEGGTFEPQ